MSTSTSLSVTENSRFITSGDLILDKKHHRVTRGDEVIPLTKGEFRMLVYFAENAGRVCSPSRLLAEFRDEAGHPLSDGEASPAVKVSVGNLRGKLELDHSAPVYITTVRGLGYRYNPQTPIPQSVDETSADSPGVVPARTEEPWAGGDR